MKWINNSSDLPIMPKVGGSPSPCIHLKPCGNYTLCPSFCLLRYGCNIQHNCSHKKK